MLMILFGVITFFLFLPKKFFELDFYTRFKDSKLKYGINIALLLRIVMGLSIGCYALQEHFFYDYPYLAILVGITVVLLIISSLKPSEVIQISTLFGIIVSACYLFYLFNFTNLDFQLLFRDFRFDFNILLFILPYCVIFDNLFYFLVDRNTLTLTKKNIVLGISASSFLFLFEYVILVLTAGGETFKGNPLVGFLALSIEPVSRYTGNFDYIYILMVGVACIFKFSYFFSLIKNSMNWSMSKLKYALAFLFIAGLCYLSYILLKINHLISYYFVISLFLFGGILIFWMIKEVIHARKTEK